MADDLAAAVERLRAERDMARAVCDSLAARVKVQSEILSRHAAGATAAAPLPVATYDNHRWTVPPDLFPLAATLFLVGTACRAHGGDTDAATLLRAFAVNLYDADGQLYWGVGSEPPPAEPDTRVAPGTPLEPPPAGPT